MRSIGQDDFARRFSVRGANLMWLLGAGASNAAGLPTAHNLVVEFKRMLYVSQSGRIVRSGDLAEPAIRNRIEAHVESLGLPESGAGDGVEQALEFGLGRCSDAVDTGRFVFERVGAVDEEHLQMDVEVRRRAESLDEGDGAGAGTGAHAQSGAADEEGGDRPVDDAQDLGEHCGTDDAVDTLDRSYERPDSHGPGAVVRFVGDEDNLELRATSTGAHRRSSRRTGDVANRRATPPADQDHQLMTNKVAQLGLP